MAAVTTERLLNLALELAGITEVPPDSGVYFSGTRISSILLGVDVSAADLFMARQLGFHAVVTYTPPGLLGPAWDTYRDLHLRQLTEVGVPADDAETAVDGGAAALRLEALRENYDTAASVAALLETPLVGICSPLATIGQRIIQQTVNGPSDGTVAGVRAALLALPEFAAARPPMALVHGAWDAPPGRIVVVTGGLRPPDYAIARAYLTHGVGTLCCADFAYEDARRLASEGVPGNVLVLGRIACASVGINPYVARLRGEGLEVRTFAGVVGGPE
ncbi:MAG: hypothetical protein OJF49_000812 [Ktedonobacterales bacterium]|jgi:hypothetical protein|nr:MAG: hypothetical protein OJF49_000812 [Ktedonobacterales bacterium]